VIETPLTPERILEAAEDVLRRFGPGKATVVDVARALGVSHGSVYRHFPSKAALRDAVTARWLHRVAEPLEAIVQSDDPAPQRLHRWLAQLIAIKHGKLRDDPELFATYQALAAQSREVVTAHVDELVGHVAAIVADGVAAGDFAQTNPEVAARAVFDATARFHNPAFAAGWSEPGIDQAFERVWSLVLAGLRAG
jgi:AcrR family transcriptional regulator